MKERSMKMLVPSNRLWDIGSFLVEFMSGPVVFFHIEVMVFTTDLATFTASQNTEITVMVKTIFLYFT